MNDQTKTINEDGSEVLDPRKALSEQTLAVDLARAEIDQAIATAHKYPRVLDTVVKKIETMACYNDEAAQNCIYALPRGGKPIVGPSIGFANILASAWGNCVDGGRPTYTDRKEKSVYAEGVFHDLESNRRTIIHDSRRIVGKNGQLYSDDMIIVTGKAAAAIARRNAILNAVPRAIWHPIYERALAIVRGTAETFVERKDKALKAFAAFGVKPEKVYMVLGLKGDIDLTLEHIPTLRGMFQALRDGSMTVEEMFDPRRMTGTAFDKIDNPLGDEAQGEPAGANSRQVDDGGEAPDPRPAQAAAAEPAGNQAQAALPLAQTASAVAEQGGEGQNAPTATAAAKPAAATKPATAKAETTPRPTSAAGYLDYWRKFCAAAKSEAIIKNQHAGDRNLRKECAPFTEEQFEEVNTIRDARIAELKG